MDLLNLSVPVIVGGIAGMTLSITGVKQIHGLCNDIIKDVAHLDEKDFSTRISYRDILYCTIFLIGCFFLSEIVICLAMFFASGNNPLATCFVLLGYAVLIITLALMFILYTRMILKTQQITRKYTSAVINDLENTKTYPTSLPPPVSPP